MLNVTVFIYSKYFSPKQLQLAVPDAFMNIKLASYFVVVVLSAILCYILVTILRIRCAKLIMALWCHMASEILISNGSGNGLLPKCAKSLPELMFKDLNMMYLTLWDQRHEGATGISQCMRRVAPHALTFPSCPWVPLISQCMVHHA